MKIIIITNTNYLKLYNNLSKGLIISNGIIEVLACTVILTDVPVHGEQKSPISQDQRMLKCVSTFAVVNHLSNCDESL